MEKIKIADLFDLEHTKAKPLLLKYEYPWQALSEIGNFIIEYGRSLAEDEYNEISENVWVSKSAKIAPTACIEAPAVIAAGTQVRHGAYIRGKVLIGENCVIGNSTELKNVIVFDNAQIPHFNYVGDSILGYCSHMGAGSITSNIKQNKQGIVIRAGKDVYETGLRKIGAMIGDFVEIGCNSVLNPGVIVGRNTNVYPLSMVRGYVPENSVYKKQGEVTEKY